MFVFLQRKLGQSMKRQDLTNIAITEMQQNYVFTHDDVDAVIMEVTSIPTRAK